MVPQEGRKEISEKRRKEEYIYSPIYSSTDSSDDAIFAHSVYIFFYTIFLIIALEILFEMIGYILENPEYIITVSLWEVLDSTRSSIAEFDPYSITLNAILISTCILIFYLVVAFINITEKGGEIKFDPEFKKLLILLVFFMQLGLFYISLESSEARVYLGFIFSCTYIVFLSKYLIRGAILEISDKNSRRKALFLLSVLFPAFVVLLFISLGFPHQLSIDFDVSFFEKLLQIIIALISVSYVIHKYFDQEKPLTKMIEDQLVANITTHPWSIGMLLLSLSLYSVLCLLLTELKEPEGVYPIGVLTLLGIVVVISGGLFICGHLIEAGVEKSRKILYLLKVSVRIEKEKDLIERLREHISSLLLDFLVVISSYICLKALFEITLAKQLEDPLYYLYFLESVNTHLSIILLVPLYIFFFRVGSTILGDFYLRAYRWIEVGLQIPPLKGREETFADTLVSLTKIAIFIIIIYDIFIRLKGIGLLDLLLFGSPFDDIIKLGVAIPIVIWIFVLIIDPFFEGETIEIGSSKGRIRKIGFFFTRLEMLTGEQIYVLNAELVLRRIKRLSIRRFRGKTQEERGITIQFLFEVPIDIELSLVLRKFTKLFDKRYAEDLRSLFSSIGYEIAEEELDFIFSSRSFPLVLIEEFKSNMVVYKLNFCVRNAFYAPIFRSYFMEKFKEEMAKILSKRWENF